jgi:hypothetical protein
MFSTVAATATDDKGSACSASWQSPIIVPADFGAASAADSTYWHFASIDVITLFMMHAWTLDQ